MNCKQGDLAYVAHSPNGLNYGKIVRCVKFLGRVENNPLNRHNLRAKHDDNWEVDPPLEFVMFKSGTQQAIGATLCNVCSDSYLRPIKGDLLDENESTDAVIEQELVRQKVFVSKGRP